MPHVILLCTLVNLHDEDRSCRRRKLPLRQSWLPMTDQGSEREAVTGKKAWNRSKSRVIVSKPLFAIASTTCCFQQHHHITPLLLQPPPPLLLLPLLQLGGRGRMPPANISVSGLASLLPPLPHPLMLLLGHQEQKRHRSMSGSTIH